MKTFRERLLSRLVIDPETGCLNWQGSKTEKGYGHLYRDGNTVRVHRAMYEMFAESIPDDLTIDHLCRNRACANVAHLEPVTNQENLRRGRTITAAAAAKTHCPAGHPYNEANTRITPQGWRKCRACHNEKTAIRRQTSAPAPRQRGD